MRRMWIVAALAVLLVGCGGSTRAAAGPPKTHGTRLDGAAAPAFALHDAAGRPVRLASFRGDWTFVTFLYTHCPDTCPLIASNLAVVLRASPVRRIRAVAISVDPKGDTPRSVRRFAAVHRLPRSFAYLIGTRRELARVWRAYHIGAYPGPEQTISHSAYTVLLDPAGRERVLYDAQVRPAEVLADLRALTR